MAWRPGYAVGLICVVSLIVTACQHVIPKDALQLSSEALSIRQLQTRRFETKDEKQLLSASSQVLQDLGFHLDESESRLGVIVASKDRDATETGQVVLALFVGALSGTPVPWDSKQKIRASLVTRPVPHIPNSTFVRVTFQRVVWNTQNQITKLESLDDPKLYQEFFSNLSKAVFLEGHEI